MATARPSVSRSGGSGRLRAIPAAMRWALQAATAASSTSSTPAMRPADPRSAGTTMPARSSSTRRCRCPTQVRLPACRGGCGQRPKRHLGVDLVQSGADLGPGPVHVQDLAGERERLAAEPLTSELSATTVGLLVGRRLHHRPGRRREHTGGLPAQELAGCGVGLPPAALRQADRDVDRDQGAGRDGGQQLAEAGRERRAGTTPSDRRMATHPPGQPSTPTTSAAGSWLTGSRRSGARRRSRRPPG
jgi:hypothetical protein